MFETLKQANQSTNLANQLQRDRRRFGGERWEPTQPFSFNEIRARRGKLNWERNHTRLRSDLRRLHWRVNLRLYGGGFGSGGRGGGSGDNNYGNSSSISVGGGSYGNLQQHQSSTKAAAAATSTTTLLLSTRSAFIETNTKID